MKSSTSSGKFRVQGPHVEMFFGEKEGWRRPSDRELKCVSFEDQLEFGRLTMSTLQGEPDRIKLLS